MTLVFGSCTYIVPEADNPSPGLEKQSVDSLVQNGTLSLKKRVLGYTKDPKTQQWVPGDKTWMCGWAPVKQSGQWLGAGGGLQVTPFSTMHCNVQFRVNKGGDLLEARTLKLNSLNDYESWSLLFTIPILKHYFYEKALDSSGREINKYKKVTEKGNWLTAPIMDLNLKGIRFYHTDQPDVRYSDLNDVFDIEVSKNNKKQFLGFSATLVNKYYGSNIQQVYRFNFLEILDNPDFKKTPYHQNNSKHMNIVHILGYEPALKTQVNYAAHWDISKPIEVCLNDFPEDARNYKEIAVDVLREMNRALNNIEDKILNNKNLSDETELNKEVFIVSKKKYKYSYDLRCPSITWVDDPSLSLVSPLGVGVANSNIKTGEILWGGAVIWGGLIDYAINVLSESSSASATGNMNSEQKAHVLSKIKHKPEFNDFFSFGTWTGFFEGLSQGFETQFNVRNLKENSLALSQKLSNKQRLNDTISLNEIKSVKDFENASLMQGQSLTFQDTDLLFNPGQLFDQKQDFLLDLKKRTNIDFADAAFHHTLPKALSYMHKPNTPKSVQSLEPEFYNALFDQEHSLGNQINGWQEKLSQSNYTQKVKAARSIIKNVTLHEWGHIMGLGHQFEGNHMPKKGMVPEKVFNSLDKEAQTNSNYTSIMDYSHGSIEIAMPYEDVKIKIHDELTLAYLYHQKYSTYRVGDEDFTFFNVLPNGIIPVETSSAENETYYTRYLPQCNDMDAWKQVNPYCRKLDIGYDAPSMVGENYISYTNDFISKMNSFTQATGNHPHRKRYYIWNQTYNLLNNNRTFYDKMRYLLLDTRLYSSVFENLVKDQKALMSFSKSCIDPSQAPSEQWSIDFTKLSLEFTLEYKKANSLSELHKKTKDTDYQKIYRIYQSVLKENSTNPLDLDNIGFKKLEKSLNKNNIAYTEIQKLCRATSKSLDISHELLSLKGNDYNTVDYNSSITPAGLYAAQAQRDTSRVFGKLEQAGLLPIRLASLDILTAPSSTMKYGWWNINKPRYADKQAGKYSYSSLYPEKFSEIIRTSVQNNMSFGGTKTQENPNLGIANLYMNYYLRRNFNQTNDENIFDSRYLSILQDQTKFSLEIKPVLLKANTRAGKPTNLKFDFTPQIFNQANREYVSLDEAYLLPGKRVIIKDAGNQIFLPISKLRFINDEAAYIWSIVVSFDKDSYDNPLKTTSIKEMISTLTNNQLDNCISGPDGLGNFIKSPDFKGYQIDAGIKSSDSVSDAMTSFEKSLNNAFGIYDDKPNAPIPAYANCNEALEGVKLTAATAMSLNGYFLPQIYSLIKK